MRAYGLAMHAETRTRTRGLSLVEVVISAFILAFISISIISAIGYSSRATRINSNALAAKSIAQSYIEKMAVDSFTSVSAQNYPDISETDDTVWLDQGLGIRCGVSFRFKGFGRIDDGCSANQVIARLEPWHASWKENEWAGDTLYLVEGKGMGQFATIQSNTADQLTLSKNLLIIPDSTTRYMINSGKTVEITTTWHYRNRKAHTQKIESLIVNYRNEDIGF